jgi:hypothetical protein
MSSEYYDDGSAGELAATEDQDAAYAAELEQQQQAYMEQEAARLAADHPELSREADAEALVTRARTIAEQLGAPHLAEDPAFWRACLEGKMSPRDDRDPGDIIVDPTPGGGRHVLPFG